MGAITIFKNQPISINLPQDFTNNGWSIVGGKAIHNGCNSGIIKNQTVNIVIGQTYIVNFNVESRTSGLVTPKLGGVTGTSVTANGTYQQTFTATTTDKLEFFSDGNLTLSLIVIYSGQTDAVTLAFNEKANKWVTYLSYAPENMVKFNGNFFTFEGGRLWQHNVNPIRNNFYGVQYKSKLTFYVNLSPTAIKQFFSIRLKSNKVWSSPNDGDISIRPTQGKVLGMRSRLKKGNFKLLQGDWFADFLRNIDDPRFNNALDSLFKGAELQGNVLKITIENDDITEVRLLSVDITVAEHNFTY